MDKIDEHADFLERNDPEIIKIGKLVDSIIRGAKTTKRIDEKWLNTSILKTIIRTQ